MSVSTFKIVVILYFYIMNIVTKVFNLLNKMKTNLQHSGLKWAWYCQGHWKLLTPVQTAQIIPRYVIIDYSDESQTSEKQNLLQSQIIFLSK